MKKIKLIMFALFCMTALFTGCSDDDGDGNDEGNGNGAGNGGAGVTVLPKKISKIVAEETNSRDTIYYKYDSENRLTKIISASKYNKTTSNIAYASDKITITEQGSSDTPQTITLRNGRATESTEYYSKYRFIYTLEYSSNGYISKMSSSEEEKINNEWIKETPFINECHINNGNLQSVTSKEEEEGTMAFEYGNTPNNTNIDLWEFIINSDDMSLLCVMGTRFKNLPSKASTSYKDGNTTFKITETYTYEVNADNYVTKMTVLTEETEETPQTKTYTITYE